jgi:hypothetical protein
VFEAEGVRFVADARAQPFIEGLVLDVTDDWGRERVIARHEAVKRCG